MANYDSAVLQKYADDLYAKAARIVTQAFILWGAPAAIITFIVVLNVMVKPKQDPPVGPAIFLAAIAGFFAGGIAGAIAQVKAFQLKLQAQQVLCQAQMQRTLDAIHDVLQLRTAKADGG